MRTKYAIFTLVTSISLGSACKYNKPSKEECEQAVSHIMELMVKERQDADREIAQRIANNSKEELLKKCIEKGTRKEIVCVLKAQSQEEVHQCNQTKKSQDPES